MANLIDAGLDTSVVLRLILGEPAGQSKAAMEALLRARRSGAMVIVSDLVAMEAYFALQTAYQVPKKEALAALALMFDSGDIQPEPGGSAPAALNECLASASKPGFVDRMIHAQYRRHGARLMTFELAAGKMPGVKVLQPLACDT